MTDLAIILVNYKSAALSIQCISSIIEFTKDISYEIILVDNDSKDDSKKRITSLFPQVKYLEMGYNAGFARANNFGVEKANSQYILLLNTDTLLFNNVLKTGMERMKLNPEISACSVNMLDMNKKENTVDPNYNVLGNLQYCFLPANNPLILKWVKSKAKKLRKSLGNQEIDFLLGAFILCRKKDFDSFNGLDEEQFLYGEDTDLSCKLALLGRLKRFDDLEIIHLEGGSTPKTDAVETFFSKSPQMQLANLVWVRKWFGPMVFLAIMLNYYIFIPFYFFIRLFRGIFAGNLYEEMRPPIQFTKQVFRWTSYFFHILFNFKAFYKY